MIFIIWDKKIAEDMSFAMCELAWTSFKNGAKIYTNTATPLNRIHPTQKPIALYAGLIKNYCKEGWKILDTHGGSMSSAIAAEKLGYDMTICELDKDYFDAGVKRFKKETSKGLFEGLTI